ncbi:shikimate dehydrogenase [Nesterenkonia sp. AN1]|uniref:Shikimate dehydrogenase (NADP(+)) n=1 Tax=Nesterenkonia aurantiaca TaxID=1436010 RepID=A0A4R7G574_9MICC|nr:MULTISPECIES: shikimate dehydrogenase [Nesterenkonia]EXF24175.1 shikimate dehydrogenase [Nesterenkonia sp. AN1]TDS86521.1 shikimate dehydrogenase [Nesterenkonia aurantiaca]
MSNPDIGRSILAGLIGHGVGPSLTPPMHELEGSRHGMRYIYRSIEFAGGADSLPDLERLLEMARRLGFNGLNITFPAKQNIMPLLDRLGPSAAMIGAVNTVLFDEDGAAVGHNTDVTGFKASIDDALAQNRCGHVVLVGAGGAGSAVAHALVMRGVESLQVVDVDAQKCAALAASVHAAHGFSIGQATPDQLPQLLARADGVVNATPFGMAHHPGTPFDPELLQPRHWVADVVYRPVDTALLLAAQKRGCLTISGLGMAMHQAADAFEIFTGNTADRSAMLQDLNALIEAESLHPGAALHR